MRRRIGALLSFGGFVGVLYYGYQYIQDSETLEVLGADVAISTGDYVPIIISAAVLVLGLALIISKKS